jgi:hypothetical protein
MERRSVAVSLDRACSFLPQPWGRHDQKRFLNWLVEECGILVYDEGDAHGYGFSHLSLQDYLAAAYIAKRPDLPIADRVFDHHWWETFRVLPTLLDQKAAQRRVAELLAVSSDPADPASFWLAGVLLADRNSSAFESWLAGLRERFHFGEWRYSAQAARAWKASHDEAARARINCDCADWTWVRWVRAREWADTAGLRGAFKIHNDGRHRRLTRAVAALLDDNAAWSSDMVALSRVFHGCGPFWPAPQWALMLLRTWPSRRARLGQMLQLVASLGADRATLSGFAKMWLSEPAEHLLFRGEIKPYILGWPDISIEPREEYADVLAYSFSLQFGHRMGSALHDNASVGVSIAQLAASFARSLFEPSIVSTTREHLTELCRCISHESRTQLDVSWETMTMDALAENGVDISASRSVWADFGLVESHSRARHSTAVALAFSGGRWDHDHCTGLLASACRTFLGIGIQDFHARLDRAHALDPLWPALARYLSGKPTNEDHAFLARTAELAEHRDPLVAAGLRFYVRGDVLTEEGELSLDEICREAGDRCLPFLEGHPLQRQRRASRASPAQPDTRYA